MEVVKDSQSEMLQQIMQARRDVQVCQDMVQQTKTALQGTREYEEHKAAKEGLKVAQDLLMGTLGRVDRWMQQSFLPAAEPRAPEGLATSGTWSGMVLNENGQTARSGSGGILQIVADQVNAGALDADGVKCSAEVMGIARELRDMGAVIRTPNSEPVAGR